MAILVKLPENMDNADTDLFKLGTSSMELQTQMERAQEFSFEFVDIDSQQRDEIDANPGYMAADNMPLQLVKPVAEDNTNLDNGLVDVVPFNNKMPWGLDAVGALTTGYNGNGVKIAVLDTGLDENHPAFTGKSNIVKRNFTTDVNEDTDGHGTHCAGTIMGNDVNDTRIGVAPGISDALIAKVIPGGSDILFEALEWAHAQGAHIASMSLGIDFPEYVNTLVNEKGFDIRAATSMALVEHRNVLAVFDAMINKFDAMEQLSDHHGMVVLAAAGNESNRPQYSIASSPPAASKNILSVAAIGAGESPGDYTSTYFSNTRPDLCAPGVDIVSAAAGTSGLSLKSGTSMACPHAAGIAALLWQQALLGEGGIRKAAHIRARLIGQCRNLHLADFFVGGGLVNAPS